METAALIAAENKLDPSSITQHVGVLEIHSPFEGTTLQQMEARQWNLYDDVDLSLHETFEELCTRTILAIKEVAETAIAKEQSDVVVTTHGDVCVAARLWGQKQPLTKEGRKALMSVQYPTYCSVTSLEVDESGVCIAYNTHQVMDTNPDGKQS
mmetsp:Transcript_45718/g.107856  ORF Transcript_45718/g.107856 Transcript_45718/m.107856 type:complete len:154 (+) Transcript_45718:228-689(+)